MLICDLFSYFLVMQLLNFTVSLRENIHSPPMEGFFFGSSPHPTPLGIPVSFILPFKKLGPPLEFPVIFLGAGRDISCLMQNPCKIKYLMYEKGDVELKISIHFAKLGEPKQGLVFQENISRNQVDGLNDYCFFFLQKQNLEGCKNLEKENQKKKRKRQMDMQKSKWQVTIYS